MRLSLLWMSETRKKVAETLRQAISDIPGGFEERLGSYCQAHRVSQIKYSCKVLIDSLSSISTQERRHLPERLVQNLNKALRTSLPRNVVAIKAWLIVPVVFFSHPVFQLLYLIFVKQPYRHPYVLNTCSDLNRAPIIKT